MSVDAERAAAITRERLDLRYAVGIVLGSGLGPLADAVTGAVRIPYGGLPGFPVSSVSSHRGELVLGRLEGVPVAVLSGRSHYYESGNPAVMRSAVETLKRIGCDTLVLTNAAGSLHAERGPGSVMLISDHIAFSGMNPLIGEPSDDRFVGLTEAYDGRLRAALAAAAAAEAIPVSTGVYMWFSGPSFETPAEIRMARILGADAVGMSTVPEAILGRFFGLRVAALSNITNLAAGMTGGELSHDETKAMAPVGAERIGRILRRYLKDRN